MEFTASELWSRVLASAKTRVPEQSFRTWLAGNQAVGLSEDELIVEAPSEFHVEWVEDKYGTLLSELVRETLGRPLRLAFRCSAPVAQPRIPSADIAPRTEPQGTVPLPHLARSRGEPPLGGDPGRGANLNDRYTFDRFVVGSNNQLAVAAGHAVAERPAKIYNPLFLYGGVGLGKTHLMHALGHAILGSQQSVSVAYVTTERFMNELVNAIQRGTTPAFRRRFREIDVLLVDDVQFLEQKESTQEEFFHTFNALYDASKQIVVTSDRPPKELPGVEERLVSRFEWGLVADIKPPDYETRVAIIQKKANDDGLVIDVETIDFVARSCTSSVREMEGAIIKLLAYSSLRNEEITLGLARTALQSVIRGREHRDRISLSAEHIRDEVARSWNVRPDGLISKKRTRDVTVPRQVAMYLIKEILDEPLVRIGRTFGGRDHSTVIHSIRKVQTQINGDPSFASRVKLIRERLDLPG